MNINIVLYSKVGEKLIEIRKLNGLTQEELSKMVNINRSTISNIEAGRQQISLHLLFKIAQVLHMEVSNFLPSLDEIASLMAEEENYLHKLMDQKNLGDYTRNSILQFTTQNKKAVE